MSIKHGQIGTKSMGPNINTKFCLCERPWRRNTATSGKHHGRGTLRGHTAGQCGAEMVVKNSSRGAESNVILRAMAMHRKIAILDGNGN